MNNENQQDLAAELQKWNLLRQSLEDVEGMDDVCLLDTLEGETNLHEAILVIDEEIAERETYVAALSERIKTLQDRKDRHDKVRERLRTIVLQAMDKAGLPKIKAPHVTISVANLPAEISVEHEELIPSRYWKPQDPVLDKKAVLESINNGEPVDGVSVGQGRINLTIRRK
ncbi:MAG: hypothetical protein DI551_10450 [Micavibrio aeruginosavorus]|uniref:Siphovirus Gp157 family protein n=1 Tax=Micavibrio aeruginosavorus TaxID=349221 RepID=A0A2W5MSW3_9BACT|nr:MAG: hypothetical protein DI551_10450 [Micavibrio aeruginosavorus]